MNKQIIASFALITLSLIAVIHLKQAHPQSSQMKHFQQWAKNHNKLYSQVQTNYRLQIFIENINKIQNHNLRYDNGQQSYKMGLNQFADLTDSEFSLKYFDDNQFDRTLAEQICTGPQPTVPTKFEDAWDWVAKGAVTNVRNQGASCIGGYAIATAQSIEGYMFIKQNKLLALSAQQIIDCSTGNGNGGCNGGDPVKSFQYLIKNGITRQETYPYIGQSQTCKYMPKTKVWDINYCTIIKTNNSALIKAGVRQQPVITTLKVNSANLKLYKSGVFTAKDCGSSNLQNYTVSIVGWDKVQQGKFANKKTYNCWKIKASLGAQWGVNGYLQLQNPGDAGACNSHANVLCPY